MSEFEFIFALFGLLLGLSIIEVLGGFARAIEAQGFKVERMDSMYLPGTPRFAGWNEWGAARPA